MFVSDWVILYHSSINFITSRAKWSLGESHTLVPGWPNLCNSSALRLHFPSLFDSLGYYIRVIFDFSYFQALEKSKISNLWVTYLIFTRSKSSFRHNADHQAAIERRRHLPGGRGDRQAVRHDQDHARGKQLRLMYPVGLFLWTITSHFDLSTAPLPSKMICRSGTSKRTRWTCISIPDWTLSL